METYQERIGMLTTAKEGMAAELASERALREDDTARLQVRPHAMLFVIKSNCDQTWFAHSKAPLAS